MFFFLFWQSLTTVDIVVHVMILQIGLKRRNPKSKDDQCFQYAVTVALNYEEIKWNLERLSNFEPFTNTNDWKGTNYPSKIDDWKMFEKSNPKIAINVL